VTKYNVNFEKFIAFMLLSCHTKEFRIVVQWINLLSEHQIFLIGIQCRIAKPKQIAGRQDIKKLAGS